MNKAPAAMKRAVQLLALLIASLFAPAQMASAAGLPSAPHADTPFVDRPIALPDTIREVRVAPADDRLSGGEGDPVSPGLPQVAFPTASAPDDTAAATDDFAAPGRHASSNQARAPPAA